MRKIISVTLWLCMICLSMDVRHAESAACTYFYSGTGHCYVPVSATGINWDSAKTAAESAGGYLVTITSSGENDFVYSLVSGNDAYWGPDIYGNNAGPWFGGYQPGGSPEPDGGWTWVNGDSWSYSHWYQPGQPDNYDNGNALHIFGWGTSKSNNWNDTYSTALLYSYIIEFNNSTCTNPPSDMVSWWSGDGHAFDLIDGNDGTLVGNATYTQGIVGKAFSFDGVNDYVQVPHSASLNITGAITMDAWIKTNAADDGIILIKGDPGCFVGSCSYGMALDPDGSVFMVMYSSGVELCRSDPGIISPNQWYHVAATWDGTTVNPNNVTLYVNGIIAKSCTKTTALNSNSEALIIGSHGSSLLRQFNGLLDEVEVFNRALNAEEIAAIYAAGSAGKCKPCFEPPSDMVSWWPFDDGTGPVAYDSIASNDGTVNGATWSSGKVGGALSFDGSNDYVALPDAASTVLNNSAGTLTAWVNPTTIGDNDIIVAYGSGSDGQGIGLGILGTVRIYHHTGAYDWQSTTPVNANEWTFLVYTWNSTTEYIYKNGAFSESRGRGPINWNYIPGHARIGHGFWGDSANAFPGLIDEVEVYTRTLAADEIAAIYAAGSAGKCKTQPEPDADADGVPDATDNCPSVANPGQEDADSDTFGDACEECDNDPNKTTPGACGCGVADTDTDIDGVADCIDNCPSVSNPDQQDNNHNGIGDICENGPDLSGNWTRLLVSNQSKALLGSIRVSNTGNRNASNFMVSCYISNNGESLDTLLKKIPVYGLAAGRSKDLSLAQVSRTSLSGKYLIAVFDSGNQVAESNEANNRAVRLIP